MTEVLRIVHQPTTPPAAREGLAALGDVVLPPHVQQRLDPALAASGGSPAWRRRKRVEAHGLLALQHLAPPGRFTVEALDVRVDLRARLRLTCPVPTLATEGGELVVAEEALLALVYPEEALASPGPHAFLRILEPADVWHANVGRNPAPVLCLGRLPIGIRAHELVLCAYGALSLQSIMLDESDASGVMNADAARFWQGRRAAMPLSRVPFLSEQEPSR